MAGNVKSTLRSAALWVAPHGVIEAARAFQELRAGGLHPRRAVPLAVSTHRRNHLRNTRLGLLPPAALDELDVVVDVGANVGDWTAGVLAVTSPLRLIALEPTPRLAEELRRRFADHREVEVVAAAAGPEDGTVRFNVTSHSHNSSVLRAREEMSDVLSGGIAVVQTVEVPQVRLDTLLAGTAVSLLKVDVQGYERAVLAGAGDVLRRTQWVLLEANFVSHYEGDTLLPELHQTMVEAGFELSNLSQPLVAGGQALFSDALYRRRA
jgi:FkbM family methyltransferase